MILVNNSVVGLNRNVFSFIWFVWRETQIDHLTRSIDAVPIIQAVPAGFLRFKTFECIYQNSPFWIISVASQWQCSKTFIQKITVQAIVIEVALREFW
jgi:hypothetical protein